MENGMLKEKAVKQYTVLVTETSQKRIKVNALSENDARTRADDAWRNAEFLLEPEDFQGVEFHVLGEIGDNEGTADVEVSKE